MVHRYRKALAEQQEFLATTDDDGRALYRKLVEPAKALLPKDAKVFIIADGSLNTLNFETLLVPDPTPHSSPHYWIEDVTVVDANSLRLLAGSRATNKRTGSLLLIGNAVAPNPDYPELRKAAVEMESDRETFPSRATSRYLRANTRRLWLIFPASPSSFPISTSLPTELPAA